MSFEEKGKLGREVAILLASSLSDRLLYGNCPAQISSAQFEEISTSLAGIDLNSNEFKGYSGITLADSPVLIGQEVDRAPSFYLNLRRLVNTQAFLQGTPIFTTQRATFLVDMSVSAWASNRILYQAGKEQRIRDILCAYHNLFLLAKLETVEKRHVQLEDDSEADFYVTKETPLFGVSGLSPNEMKRLRTWEKNNSPFLDRVRYRRCECKPNSPFLDRVRYRRCECKPNSLSHRIPRDEYLRIADRADREEAESFI